MCQLKLVKTAKARARADDTAADSTLNEGTKAIKEFFIPWATDLTFIVPKSMMDRSTSMA